MMRLLLAGVLLGVTLHVSSCVRCDADEVNENGECLQLCNADGDCPGGEICEEGRCRVGTRPPQSGASSSSSRATASSSEAVPSSSGVVASSSATSQARSSS